MLQVIPTYILLVGNYKEFQYFLYTFTWFGWKQTVLLNYLDLVALPATSKCLFSSLARYSGKIYVLPVLRCYKRKVILTYFLLFFILC